MKAIRAKGVDALTPVILRKPVPREGGSGGPPLRIGTHRIVLIAVLRDWSGLVVDWSGLVAANARTSEGVIRRYRFHRGAWRDYSLFSIIRDEWSNQAKMPSQLFYTDEHPSGSWSRALYQKRTGKPFIEEEFKKDFEVKKTLGAY